MGNTIVFANQKGGVGKTTSAVNLGAFLAELGRKVLLIDFDPQGNLSSSVGKSTQGQGIYEVITEEIDATSAVEATAQTNLSIITSSINLTGANIELVELERREYFLRNAIAGIQDEYDYIFIDSPPSLGLLTLNGLVAADAAIIPLQCEYFAMEGLTQLLQSIKRVQQSYNADLDISGILFTMYDSRTRLAQDVVQEVVGYFGKRVFRTIIPRNVRLSEAPSHGIPINQYDPDSTGGKSYRKLAEEVIERG